MQLKLHDFMAQRAMDTVLLDGFFVIIGKERDYIINLNGIAINWHSTVQCSLVNDQWYFKLVA